MSVERAHSHTIAAISHNSFFHFLHFGLFDFFSCGSCTFIATQDAITITPVDHITIEWPMKHIIVMTCFPALLCQIELHQQIFPPSPIKLHRGVPQKTGGHPGAMVALVKHGYKISCSKWKDHNNHFCHGDVFALTACDNMIGNSLYPMQQHVPSRCMEVVHCCGSMLHWCILRGGRNMQSWP